MNMNCPCHSGSSYETCCKPFHSGEPAPTPLALMRSRYSAYALNLADYIMETTDPDGPMFEKNRDAWRNHLLEFSENTTFTGLKIDDSAQDTVTFTALLQSGNKDASFTEKSLFVNKNGRWLYHGFAPDS